MNSEPYRKGYYDGMYGIERRGSQLYKPHSAPWKAYQTGYQNGEKRKTA